jgi:hypothetical protein
MAEVSVPKNCCMKRTLPEVLKDRFWLVVVALVIVAAGLVALALIVSSHLQQTIS